MGAQGAARAADPTAAVGAALLAVTARRTDALAGGAARTTGRTGTAGLAFAVARSAHLAAALDLALLLWFFLLGDREAIVSKKRGDESGKERDDGVAA